eukprot:8145320-Alexandrium_andersonii.AAC.1
MATRTSPELDWGSSWTVVRAGRRGRIDKVRGGRGKQRVARTLPLFVAPTVALKFRHPKYALGAGRLEPPAVAS